MTVAGTLPVAAPEAEMAPVLPGATTVDQGASVTAVAASPAPAEQAARDLAPASLAVAELPENRPLQGDGPDVPRTTCTTAQLRRFIKSRPWVPMHELRRRFGIWGGDDDVSPMRVGEHTLFVGLPPAESRMIAELLNSGDVGYELSLDPEAPVVVGVYPMRPVPRS